MSSQSWCFLKIVVQALEALHLHQLQLQWHLELMIWGQHLVIIDAFVHLPDTGLKNCS